MSSALYNALAYQKVGKSTPDIRRTPGAMLESFCKIYKESIFSQDKTTLLLKILCKMNRYDNYVENI